MPKKHKPKNQPSSDMFKNSTDTQKLDPQKNAIPNRQALFAIAAAAVLLIIGYIAYSKFFVAAYVNGQPISRLEVIRSLEQQAGKRTLSQLVAQKLVFQEAEKKNITVNQSDIDREIKTIEASLKSQGMTLDQALQAQGVTRAQLDEQIRSQVLLTKLIKPVAVTDKEIEDYIDKNKAQFTQEQLDQKDFKSQIKTQLTQQKQQDEIQKYIAELEKKAKVVENIKY